MRATNTSFFFLKFLTRKLTRSAGSIWERWLTGPAQATTTWPTTTRIQRVANHDETHDLARMALRDPRLKRILAFLPVRLHLQHHPQTLDIMMKRLLRAVLKTSRLRAVCG